MSNVLLVDGVGKIGNYLRSVNTPDYRNGTNLINPDLSHMDGIPKKFWKMVAGQVVEMTQVEQDAITQAEADALAQSVEDQVQDLRLDMKEVMTALIQVINVRIPGNPITKAELVQKIKDNR